MSMLLKAQNGNEFELSFSQDALPDTQDGFGDATWATVLWRAATEKDEWEESSPSVSLFEFAGLADWLEAVAGGAQALPGRAPREADLDETEIPRAEITASTGAPDISELELLEPELKFSVTEHTSTGVTLRIDFHLKDRPEEFNVDAPTDEAAYMHLHLSRENLLAASAALRAMLADMDDGSGKDDLDGDRADAALGDTDADMDLIDSIEAAPPGAGDGEDNAGER